MESLLHREFGAEWEISIRPAGLDACQAVRRDGSSVDVITERTPGELLGRLRALRDGDYGNGLPLDEEGT